MAENKLSDAELEALAHGFDEWVDEALRESSGEDNDEWRTDVAEARALSIELGLALREAAVPEVDLDALVEEAIARQAPPPSEGALWRFGSLALVIALALIAFALSLAPLFPTPEALAGLGRAGLALLRMTDRAVTGLPGGWASVAFGTCALILMAWPPARALIRKVGLTLVGLWAMSTAAQAQQFEGAWPEQEAGVTVVVNEMPVMDVVELAASSIGLDVVGHVPGERRVSVSVRNGSLREVLDQALEGSSMVVERRDAVLLLRPAGETMSRVGAERVAFGEDVSVAAGERVENVAVFGGNAFIAGEVLGDVVVFGGELQVAPSGQVHGERVVFGGSPDIEVVVAEPEDSFLGKLLYAAATYVLLFLFGLFLMGVSGERFRGVAREIATEPLRSGVFGALLIAGSSLLALLLTITVVGIPVLLIVAPLFFVSMYAGIAAGAAVLGAGFPILGLRDRPIAQLAFGTGLLFVTTQVPYFGWLMFVVVACVGLGAIARSRFGRSPVF